MKKYISIILSVLLLLTLVNTSYIEASTQPLVSVKLENYLGNKKSIKLEIVGEYSIEGTDQLLQQGKVYYVKNENSSLVLYENTMKLKTYSESFTIIPQEYGQSHYVKIEDRAYLGTIQFTKDEQYVRPINRLPLNDYLKGVVPNEMPASWNLEALKAQAVTARTYSLARINQTLVDTTANQVYGGYMWNSSRYENSNKAVDETSGKAVYYEGSLAAVFYSSSNGGHTESNKNYGWSSAALPYLPSKPDPYDPAIPWSLSFSKEQIPTSSLDLSSPGTWWDTTNEVATGSEKSALDGLKNYIMKNHNLNATEIKIVSIPGLSMTGKYTINDLRQPSGKQTSGNISVAYFVKNKDGYFDMTSGSQLPENYSKTLSGETRYQTSVSIADFGWKNGAEVVVLTRGDNPIDSFGGSVLAKKYNSPLMLTTSSKLPTEVLNQLKVLNPSSKKVYILGGKNAINETVLNEIRNLGLDPVRISGETRYETAVEVAKQLDTPTEVFITTGQDDSPDALTIASYAASIQAPILLNRKESLDSSVKKYLLDNSIKKVTLIGGTGVLEEAIQTELKNLNIEVTRVSGHTRYETSLAVVKKYNFDYSNLYFAQGNTFIDALPGAALAAMHQSPVVLTEKSELPATIEEWIKGLGQRPYIYYLGGEAAIDQTTKSAIKAALQGDIKLYHLDMKDVEIGKIRSIFGVTRFKSNHVAPVSDQDGKWIINGKGYGHGIGMSQYGAEAMGVQGKTYDQILEFYFPKTSLTK